MYWDEEERDSGRVQLKRRPVRIDLSYMVTCWTSVAEDQHRLLWRMLETFFCYSPLPEEILQGRLKELVHTVRTEVSQPDGILKNVSDFWGALENQLRPAINLVVTLDLDLNQLVSESIAFARVLKFGQPVVYRDGVGREYRLRRLAPGWEAAPIRLAGVVRDDLGKPVQGVSVRLIGVQEDGRPLQVGPTIETDPSGRYVLDSIPSGEYTLVTELPGRAPQQHPLILAVRERGEPLPELVHEVEVSMSK
jgi:hypothetical protein